MNGFFLLLFFLLVLLRRRELDLSRLSPRTIYRTMDSTAQTFTLYDEANVKHNFVIMPSAIVVGGGLSGLSAHTLIQSGVQEFSGSNPFLGGNSTKATSGIRAGSRTQ